MCLHFANPASDIPHDPSASNIRRDLQKGSHVVILSLNDAPNSVKYLHFSILLSDMPHISNVSDDDADSFDADNLRRDFANGPHVVIFGLPLTVSSTIALQCDRPLLLIPHIPDAYNIRRDLQNGSHVVIFALLFAFSCVILVHWDKLVSLICWSFDKYDTAYNIRRDFANGSHVVIFGLQLHMSCIMLLHDCNPSSHIPELLHADSLRRDFANGFTCRYIFVAIYP